MKLFNAIVKHKKKLLPLRDKDDKHIPPKNCVELFIYDNDGPEGFCDRLRFPRSSDAVLFLKDVNKKDIRELNFEITNYWGK